MNRVLGAAALLITLTGCMKTIPQLMPAVDGEQGLSAEFPYESRFVDVLDSTMHYVDEGEGPPMVLVHGNPTSSYLWRNVIPHLSQDHRVIAVDLIGMGQSGKPDIAYRFEDQVRYFDAFMSALDLEDVVLVVHDWGGGVGIDHAMRHQDNLRGLAFMEAMILPMSWDRMVLPERILFRTMRSEKGDDLILEENYFVEALLPALSGRELSEEEMAHYRAPYPTPADRTPTRVFPQEVPFDGDPADNYERLMGTYERLKTTDVPLLMLVAEPGAIMTPHVVERLQADLPKLETKSIGPGLHFIQESQPTAIGQAVNAWAVALPEWEGPAEPAAATASPSAQ